MSQDLLFFQNDGRVFVKRKSHETYKNKTFSMIWRWWFDCLVCKADLNNDGHLDIISSSVIPSANLLRFAVNLVFEDDSAQPHRTNAVKQWRFDQNMRCLEWPPQSQNLNSVEN